jgi:ABC-type dipeptide/oligopeptide/nickel transport system ATPase subunit
MSPIRSADEMNLPARRVVAVDDLSVTFIREGIAFDAVRHLSFHVDRGETLAIVGESGSGKSVTSLALMRLVEHGGGAVSSGQIAFRCRSGPVLDIARASPAAMRKLRGADIAMIFQEPMTSLNPVFTVGDQISEAIALHQGKRRGEVRAEALRLLDLVRIPEARRVFARYPHQLSGGMRQRVMAFARLVRGNTLMLKHMTYVEAARSIGASDFTIIVRHILPRTVSSVIVYFTMHIGTSIITAASLSFLGLGAQPPTPEWGAMLNEARADMVSAPHIAIFPSLAIFLTVLAFNLLGDGLRDALDPKLERR